MKLCKGCGEEKALDAFSLAKRGKFGRAFYCRPCAAAKRRELHDSRKDDPEYRAKNAARARLWREDPANSEKDRESSRRWYRENTQVAIDRAAAWVKANPERYAEHKRRYLKANPEVGQAHVQNRRAAVTGSRGTFTSQEWREVQAEFNYACAYCLATGVPLQQEHMQPLSKGGRHDRSNIVPSCAPCNLRKGAGTLLDALSVLV